MAIKRFSLIPSQDAGRRQTRCNLKDSDERCVEEMQHNDVAFQSYTTFFHHVRRGGHRGAIGFNL